MRKEAGASSFYQGEPPNKVQSIIYVDKKGPIRLEICIVDGVIVPPAAPC